MDKIRAQAYDKQEAAVPLSLATDDAAQRLLSVSANAVPLFDCFRVAANLDELAGDGAPPPVFRPIEFSLIPEQVSLMSTM